MAGIKTDDWLKSSQSLEFSRTQHDLQKAKNLANKELNSEAEVEKATKGFEALLLHQMLKEMWSTVQTTGLLGENSNEARIYRDMLNQAIADSVAEGRGIGIKDMLRKELLKAEKASKE